MRLLAMGLLDCISRQKEVDYSLQDHCSLQDHNLLRQGRDSAGSWLDMQVVGCAVHMYSCCGVLGVAGMFEESVALDVVRLEPVLPAHVYPDSRFR